MPEPNAHIRGDVQYLVIGGCTYEIHSIFGNKIKLEDILARRILKELDKKSAVKQSELAIFSTVENRPCSGK
ncbi:MAG: hypothetical protein LBS84_06910 [Clostridiales bacterium]|nr:hypothetical protein [Clostridiales bacterium]